MMQFFSNLSAINSNPVINYDSVALVIGGQSNARANTQGDDPSSQYLGLADGSQIYNYNNGLWLNIDFNSVGSVDGLSFGIDIPFGHKSSNASLPCRMGKRAESSTSLKVHWQPGTTLNNDMKEAINAVKTKLSDDGLSNPLWVFYWNQGEKDANDGTTVQEYVDNWNLIFGQWDAIQSFDIIYMCKTNSNLDPITYQDLGNVRTAQQQIIDSDSRYRLIDMNDYALGPDGLHYTGPVQEAIGERVFTELNLT